MDLKEKRAGLLDAAQAIIGKSGGDMSPAQEAEVRKAIADVEEIDVQLKTIERSQQLKHLLGSGAGNAVDPVLKAAQSGLVSQAWQLNDDQFKGMFTAARASGNAMAEIPGRKAFISTPGTPIRITGLTPGIYLEQGSLLDFFPHRGIPGPTVRIYKTTTAASVAAVTAEGAAKPDAGLVIGSQDVTVAKIAATSKFSDEMLSDYVEFASMIGNEVASAVKVRENIWAAALLLGTSGIQSFSPTAGVTVVDAVADGIATMQANGIYPTGIAMAPADMAKARKSKASTAGSYNFDPLADGPNRLWGLDVVVTPSLSANTVLLGDFANAGWVGVRDPLRLEVGLDSDDFTRNLRTLRVEERLLLAMVVPSRVMKITLS
jgi:hypothetical protein